MSPQLVILSGPPHAGKSAAAEALCARYDRMVHVDAGMLHDFIRMGRLRPWDESSEGRRQRGLVVGSACDMARRFVDAGYGVVIDDIVLPEDLALYRAGLDGVETVAHLVMLLPAREAVLKQERERSTEWRRAGRLDSLYDRLAAWEGVARVDPGSLTPELVADQVMALAAEGRARLAGSEPGSTRLPGDGTARK